MNKSKFMPLCKVASVSISNVDKKTSANESEVLLCNYVDVYRNWAITEGISSKLMKATANNHEIEKFSLHKGDVCITKDSETKDDIGMSTFIADDIQGLVLGYHCALISPQKDVLDGKYLNAFLQTEFVRHYYELNASGSGQRYTLTLDIIGSIPVPVIPLAEQRKIGHIFSAIDRKIESNNKINDNLQHQLKLLYDYWFTQFDFPDENGKPYRASGGAMVWNEQLKRDIPSGWQVKAIGDLITSDRGISYSTKTISDKGTPMVNLASFTPIGEYKPEGIKYYTGEYSLEKILSPFDLVMCNTQQTAIDYKKDIIGRSLLIPDIFDGDIVSSHHVTHIKPYNKLLKCYLHYLFNTDYFHKYIASHTNGTNILGLLFYGVEEFCIPIPDDDTLGKFETLVLNSEKIKSTILKENQDLISLRDWLLPMLMNGQATISD